jgi:hypothetical protein
MLELLAGQPRSAPEGPPAAEDAHGHLLSTFSSMPSLPTSQPGVGPI